MLVSKGSYSAKSSCNIAAEKSRRESPVVTTTREGKANVGHTGLLEMKNGSIMKHTCCVAMAASSHQDPYTDRIPLKSNVPIYLYTLYTLHSITLPFITWTIYVTLHSTTLYTVHHTYITLRYVTLPFLTLPYLTLRHTYT